MLSLTVWTACAVMSAGSTLATSSLNKEPSFPVQVLETRRGPDYLQSSNVRNLRNDMVTARLQQRESPEVFKTNGSLDISWNNAELFSYGLLSVTCTTCYVKGNAFASLVVDDDFNVTSAFEGFVEAFGSELKNLTVEVWDQFKEWAEEVAENVTDTVGQDFVNAFQGDFGAMEGIDFDDYEFPTIDMDFNVNLTDMPEAKIKLEFNGLELYMLLDASLEADQTFTIPLYPKSWYQPAGIAVGSQEIGIIISLDLILHMDAQASISSGIHISFEDGLAVELAMFGRDVSTITLTDGSFEFLPVTLSTSGLVLDATLRLGVTAGLNMSADIADVVDLGAGALAQVFADLAHFQTNVTPSIASTELKRRDDTNYSKDCELPVVETYEFGLGAQAGVFVEFDHDTWGPTPNTSIQIFYTTLYSACATSITTSESSNGVSVTSSAVAKRTDSSSQSLTLGSATSVYTVTNVLCQSPSLRNCPASLQSTNQTVRTSTVYSSVPVGSDVTFPATTTTGSLAAIQTFGSNMNQVKASSGSPVSYVPPTSTSSGAGSNSTEGVSGAINGVKDGYESLSEKDKKLVIGLSAGLGSALLTALAASFWYCRRRPNKASKQGSPLLEGPYEVSDASHPFLKSESTQKLKWKTSSSSITVSHLEQNTAYESPRRT